MGGKDLFQYIHLSAPVTSLQVDRLRCQYRQIQRDLQAANSLVVLRPCNNSNRTLALGYKVDSPQHCAFLSPRYICGCRSVLDLKFLKLLDEPHMKMEASSWLGRCLPVSSIAIGSQRKPDAILSEWVIPLPKSQTLD